MMFNNYTAGVLPIQIMFLMSLKIIWIEVKKKNQFIVVRSLRLDMDNLLPEIRKINTTIHCYSPLALSMHVNVL